MNAHVPLLGADVPEVISLATLAKYSGIQRPSLYPHIRAGHLKVRRIGRRTLISKTDANLFLSRLIPLEGNHGAVTIRYIPPDE